MVLILCVIFVLNFHESRGLLVRKYPLLMPNVNPDRVSSLAHWVAYPIASSLFENK